MKPLPPIPNVVGNMDDSVDSNDVTMVKDANGPFLGEGRLASVLLSGDSYDRCVIWPAKVRVENTKLFNKYAVKGDAAMYKAFNKMGMKEAKWNSDFKSLMDCRKQLCEVSNTLFMMTRGENGVDDFYVWNKPLDALMTKIIRK